MTLEQIRSIMTEREAAIDTLIAKHNTCLEKNDAAGMNAALASLKEEESAYAAAKSAEVMNVLVDKEDPVKAAIEQLTYQTIAHKSGEGESGDAKPIEKTVKDRYIDLVALCRKANKPADWRFKVERLNHLLTVRVAEEIKVSKARIKSLLTEFNMNDKAKAIDFSSEKIISNTTLSKVLQGILDDLLPESGMKVNSHDVMFLIHAQASKGAPLTIKTAANSGVMKAVCDILNRVVTGGVYDVNFKVKKASAKPDVKPMTIDAAEIEKLSPEARAIVEKALGIKVGNSKSAAEKAGNSKSAKTVTVKKSAAKTVAKKSA